MNKRSALSHLFRAHNRKGFPTDFRMEIGNLFRGFFREILDANNNAINNRSNMLEDDEHLLSTKEGK
jgi:hypothetical protein